MDYIYLTPEQAARMRRDYLGCTKFIMIGGGLLALVFYLALNGHLTNESVRPTTPKSSAIIAAEQQDEAAWNRDLARRSALHSEQDAKMAATKKALRARLDPVAKSRFAYEQREWEDRQGVLPSDQRLEAGKKRIQELERRMKALPR